MLHTNLEYEESVLDYEDTLQTIKIASLSKLELKIIDQVLYSYIDHNWKKAAFIIGKTLKNLKDGQQITLFNTFLPYQDLLLAQRLQHLSDKKIIEVNGDIRAIRFSEVRLSTPL